MKKVFLIACAVSSLSLSAQTVSKKVSLNKGEQLEQVSQINMNITQEAMGQVMEIKMESNVTSLVEVKNTEPNGYAVANTLKKVLMNMNGMGQEMKFDSDKEEDLDGQIGEAYRDKIGKEQEYTISKEGIVTSVKNKDSAKDDGSTMFGNMAGAVTTEREGSTFNALANIPAAGAKVGDSWTDSSNADGTKAVTTYTLKEVKGSDGIVSINSDLSVNRELQQQGMTMQMDMKGTTTGEYTFDVNTGIIKSRKATTKATGAMDVMGSSIPMTMETTLTSTVNKK